MRISESYRSYHPPTDIVPSIRRLLASIPGHHLTSLDSIHLTDSATIGRGKTHRVQGKKYIKRQCLGFYHPASMYGRAWIELSVDQILKDIPPFFARRAFVLDVMFADTLFHEIGHHIEYTSHAANPASERNADTWKRLFTERYMREHYRWLRPPLRLLRRLFACVRTLWNELTRRGK